MTAPVSYRTATGEEIVLAEVPEDIRQIAVTIGFATGRGEWWLWVPAARESARIARAAEATEARAVVFAEVLARAGASEHRRMPDPADSLRQTCACGRWAGGFHGDHLAYEAACVALGVRPRNWSLGGPTDTPRNPTPIAERS